MWPTAAWVTTPQQQRVFFLLIIRNCWSLRPTCHSGSDSLSVYTQQPSPWRQPLFTAASRISPSLANRVLCNTRRWYAALVSQYTNHRHRGGGKKKKSWVGEDEGRFKRWLSRRDTIAAWRQAGGGHFRFHVGSRRTILVRDEGANKMSDANMQSLLLYWAEVTDSLCVCVCVSITTRRQRHICN